MQMNAVLGILCSIISMHSLDAVAAVKFVLQKLGNLSHRFLLLDRIHDMLSGTSRIAADKKYIVNLCLGKRKSGRHCSHAFRFINMIDLFHFCTEQIHEGHLLKLSGLLIHEWSAVLISKRKPAIIYSRNCIRFLLSSLENRFLHRLILRFC